MHRYQVGFRADSNRPLYVLRYLLTVALSITGVCTPVFAAAEDYAEQWGPAIGSTLPVLEAYDQSGQLRTLDNLTGQRGLLLFLNRSADW